MYVYEIKSWFYHENEEEHSTDYITHDKKFTKDCFFEMCSEELNKLKDKCPYSLKKNLIKNYGFKRIKPLYRYEFKENDY